jgi:hypothetical protein
MTYTVPGENRTAVTDNGGGRYNHSLFWGWLYAAAGGWRS